MSEERRAMNFEGEVRSVPLNLDTCSFKLSATPSLFQIIHIRLLLP
jgi:hypothetical protein